MLPSRELEYRILKLLITSGRDWQPTSTPQLALDANSSRWPEVVAALRRLHANGRLELRKFRDDVGYETFTGKESDGEFFYRASYELKIAPAGRPYVEELEQVRSGKGLSLKAYLDNNVVSALAKADMRPETLAALKTLLERFNEQKLELVTSDLSRKEIDAVPKTVRDKWHLDVVVALLNKVPFIDDHELRGFHSHFDRFGGASYPLIEDDPISSALRRIGLDRTDAHHLMLAIRAECDVFVTCDKRTILNRRAEIEQQFPIRLITPEELMSKIG